jgi:hypothetical protein
MNKRATYVMRGGRLVRKDRAAPLNVAHGRGAHVITDEMPATKHMGTGQMITSKAKFRHATRASGCVEIGTDPAAMRGGRVPDRVNVAEIVQRAYAQAESR